MIPRQVVLYQWLSQALLKFLILIALSLVEQAIYADGRLFQARVTREKW